MALSDQHRIEARGDVLSRHLDGEAVLLDLASGVYFGLDEVGSEIWALIVEGATVAAIRDKILGLYDVDAETVQRDLEALVAELSSRGLIDVSGPEED